MKESDLEEISRKFRMELDDGNVAIPEEVFGEAFETDPTENLILETGDGEIAGFSFCGITHERDERHQISVGYIGYSIAPTVFAGHYSTEKEKLLWENVLDSLRKRKADAVRLSRGVSISTAPAKGVEELAKGFGFAKWSKDGGSETFYADLGLKLSEWKERPLKPEYKIRRMEEKDISEVVEILDTGFEPMEPGNRQRNGVRARMRNGWVCEMDERVVGCIFAQPYENKNLIEVRGFAVHPDYRNRGIATEMMKSVLNCSKASGVEVVMAGYRNDNLATERVQRKLGFDERHVSDRGQFYIFYKELKAG